MFTVGMLDFWRIDQIVTGSEEREEESEDEGNAERGAQRGPNSTDIELWSR